MVLGKEPGTNPVLARHPALEEAARGGDAAALAVYADWLIDQGSPWGQLLATERAKHVDKALRRRCVKPLHALFASMKKPAELRAPSFAFHWDQGVVTKIRWASFEGSEELYEMLLRLPCVALASALWLGDGPYDDWEQISELAYDTASIAAHGLPRAVTKLGFDLSGRLMNNNGDMAPAEPPQLRPIMSRLAQIRELSTPTWDDFSQLAELQLEALDIESGFTSDNLRSVGDLPSTLRRLRLTTRQDYDGAEPELGNADLKAFFAADLSRLRELSLEPCDLPGGDSPLELLLSSGWLQTLERLRLIYRHIDVSNELTLLAAKAGAFAHLRAFELEHEPSGRGFALESPSEAELASAARALSEDRP